MSGFLIAASVIYSAITEMEQCWFRSTLECALKWGGEVEVMWWRAIQRRSGLGVMLLVLLLATASCVAQDIGEPTSGFVVPYNSYLFDFWGKSVPSPQAYAPERFITGTHLGVGPFRDPSDMCVGRDQTLYVVDSGNNRIIHIDKDFTVLEIIKEFDNNGATDTFRTPRGMCVTSDGHMYVADTGNSRVVHFDADGQLVRIIGPPTADVEGVLPAGFAYRPFKVGVDQHNRMYVVSQDTFDGLLQFNAAGEFGGFVGAPRVTPDLWEYIWYRIATKSQRERMTLFLPTEYSNLDLDAGGFIYATVMDNVIDDDANPEDDKIRRLNAKGEDLLVREGFHGIIGDVEYASIHTLAANRGQSIMVDIVVHDHGVYSVLDNIRSRVYTYDDTGNLLHVFGYRGTQKGQTAKPVALAAIDRNMLILDSQQLGIAIYRPTDYGMLIWAALDYYSKGDYAQTEAIWRQVLELNSNCDVAYTGIGRALLRRDQYAEAMANFKLGNNRKEYSEAFELYRREVIYDNLSLFVVVLLAVIIAVYLITRLVKRVRTVSGAAAQVASTSVSTAVERGREPVAESIRTILEELKYALHVIFHPLEGFWELKYLHKGSVVSATVILVAFCLTYVFSRQFTGFIFNTVDLSQFNVVLEVVSILLPFGLWCGVNWALTTLMEGKGTIRDVYIATAYSLVPLIFILIPLTIVSNFIISEEGALFYTLPMTLGLGWTGILVVFGAVMTTHEYDLPKTVLTCIFTVAGMVFAMFLALLFVDLVEQVIGFANELVTEFAYRT